MKKLFFGIIAGLLLSSCNIYRTISFNADHSGSIDNKIDMSSMMAMMNSTGGGGMGSMSDLESLNQSKAMLENISGISNVKVSFDTTGIMYSSYDFNSTEAMLAAMSSGGATNSMMLGMNDGNTSDLKPKLTYKGKKFYFEEIDKKTLKKLGSKEGKSEMAQMDMMLASSTIYTTINFPDIVKKVSYKNAAITNDKTVSFSNSVKDFLSPSYKPLVVNFK